jgi:hypothetical protein
MRPCLSEVCRTRPPDVWEELTTKLAFLFFSLTTNTGESCTPIGVVARRS